MQHGLTASRKPHPLPSPPLHSTPLKRRSSPSFPSKQGANERARGWREGRECDHLTRTRNRRSATVPPTPSHAQENKSSQVCTGTLTAPFAFIVTSSPSRGGRPDLGTRALATPATPHPPFITAGRTPPPSTSTFNHSTSKPSLLLTLEAAGKDRTWQHACSLSCPGLFGSLLSPIPSRPVHFHARRPRGSAR